MNQTKIGSPLAEAFLSPFPKILESAVAYSIVPELISKILRDQLLIQSTNKPRVTLDDRIYEILLPILILEQNTNKRQAMPCWSGNTLSDCDIRALKDRLVNRSSRDQSIFSSQHVSLGISRGLHIPSPSIMPQNWGTNTRSLITRRDQNRLSLPGPLTLDAVVPCPRREMHWSSSLSTVLLRR